MTDREKTLARDAYGPHDVRVSHGCYELDAETDALLFDAPPVITGQGSYANDATEGAGAVFWWAAALVVTVIVGVALWL